MITTLINRIEYTATASQTTFPYPFRVDNQNWLKVYQNGVLKTLTTHYTVTGVGSDSGGNVVLVTGATAGDSVIIIRGTPNTQETNYVENDKFPAEAHEEALDKLTMIAQDLTEGYGRCIRFKPQDTQENWYMPTVAANKFLRINSDGDGLELATIDADATYNVLSAKGDLIYGTTGGVAERLPIGTEGQILRVASGLPVWDDDDAATYAVITSKGDLIRGNNSGAPERLAIGSTGQVLTVSGGTAVWAPNVADVITSAGDLIEGNLLGQPARLAIGTEGDVLVVNSSGFAIWENRRASAARAYRGTNQSINGNTYTKVQCANESYDYGGCYDHVTNHLYTVPVTGVYLVVGRIQLTGTATQKMIMIYYDGVAVSTNARTFAAASSDFIEIKDMIACVAGKTIGLYVYSTTDADTVLAGPGNTFLAIVKVA